jgi:GT2 family glycosyltransferase
MDLSIVIVNWNSIAYLREAIVSIYKYTRDLSFEIIVVDNASTDGGVRDLKDDFPMITVVESRENLGFSRANNLGYQHSSGNYLLFLNPDTKLVTPAINIMLGAIKSLPEPGVVGCKLLNSDFTVQTSCVQTFPTITNQVLDVEYLRLRWPSCKLWRLGALFSKTETPVEVDMVSGACLMLKREVFEQVGLFSEEYFMYAEDLDLCYKVRRSGLTNYYISTSSVVHHGGKSSNQQNVSQWSVVMKFNSIFKFCVKTRGNVYGVAYRIAMGASALIRLVLLTAMLGVRSSSGKAGALKSAVAKWIAVLKWSLGFGFLVSERR